MHFSRKRVLQSLYCCYYYGRVLSTAVDVDVVPAAVFPLVFAAINVGPMMFSTADTFAYIFFVVFPLLWLKVSKLYSELVATGAAVVGQLKPISSKNFIVEYLL